MSIESSSGYGENCKPIIGFSLLQPQNDPKKCLYLLVAHSSLIERLKINNLSDHKSKTNASANELSKKIEHHKLRHRFLP